MSSRRISVKTFCKLLTLKFSSNYKLAHSILRRKFPSRYKPSQFWNANFPPYISPSKRAGDYFRNFTVTCVPALKWFVFLTQTWLNLILSFLKRKIPAWDAIGGFLVTTLWTNWTYYIYKKKLRLVLHYFITTNKKPYALILNSILEHELCMCTLIGKKLKTVP